MARGKRGNGGMIPHGSTPVRLEDNQPARGVLDRWAESLAEVLESMTDHRPKVQWHCGAGPWPRDAAGQPLLWWEQPFRGAPEMSVWVGVPRALWEYAGTLTLKAAGLEDVVESEARNTWFEILGQSLGQMALSIGAVLGHEVGCDGGSEKEPNPQAAEWASIAMEFPESDLPPGTLVLAPAFLATLSATETPAEVPDVPEHLPEDSPATSSRTMELLLDVDLPVSISFGRTQLPLRDVLKLMTGSIVELNRGVNDQVDVLVNHCLVARGEVVVVEGNYGVRIQEIATRRERLRSLQ
jgi:flagellar motor switch protein FliN/FliY